MHGIARRARAAALALGALLAARASIASSILPIASAQPRAPQVAVQGTGLLQFFQSVSEPIAPSADQVNVELLTTNAFNNSTTTYQVELAADPGLSSSGIYNGYDSHPALMQVFPVGAQAGWFAVFSFRTAPVRAIVNLFDEQGNFQGSSTYLGADKKGIGFYVAGAAGPLYSQDARNPGARPQLLFYRGTGLNAGSAWLGMEDQSLATGSDADYDDVVWFIEGPLTVCVHCDGSHGDLTPVHETSWGELKSRFH